jgi:hypothetical protein
VCVCSGHQIVEELLNTSLPYVVLYKRYMKLLFICRYEFKAREALDVMGIIRSVRGSDDATLEDGTSTELRCVEITLKFLSG